MGSRQGIEPQSTDLETVVLPLDYLEVKDNNRDTHYYEYFRDLRH